MSEPRSFRIILIEDDADLCQGWIDVFELLGHQVKCFQRGLDALMDLNSIATFDLIITDYYLPDLNGVELIKRVRALNPNLPAVLLTGSRESSVVEAAKTISNCLVLHKPLSIEDLENRIGDLLGSR